MVYRNVNKLFSKFSGKNTAAAAPDYDPDCLVDYEEPVAPQMRRRTIRRLSKESLTKQLDKCKKMITTNKDDSINNNNHHFNYTLEYTEKGYIKRPAYYVESTGDLYYIPITMDVIRSLILKQHCQISKPEEVLWFEDGLKWLSQQQYQNSYNSNNGSKSSCKYRYYIEEEGDYYDEKKDWRQMKEIDELERACEAYFGIPLGLCENSWAAEYLVSQASKGKLLRRVTLQPSLKKVSFSLRKLWCF